MAFMVGVSIGPLIAGQLIQNYGWRIAAYAMAAALVVNLILAFFFMPETAYHRPEELRIDAVERKVCLGALAAQIHPYLIII